MKAVSFREFDRVYQGAADEVLSFWTPEMQETVAVHNHGWGVGRTDFAVYLRVSSRRFYRAYTTLRRIPGARTVCDVGGFWGVFPVALRRLGYEVTMTEALGYYGESFQGLWAHLRDQGVGLVDYDPFQSDTPGPGRYDFITAMAVLEHYPHSPRHFLENLVSMLGEKGRLYVEVPNIAFWNKRIDLLFGRTPLVPIGDILRSATPFIGHHHEYTVEELRDLGRLVGLEVEHEALYNYSPTALPHWKSLLAQPLQFVAFALAPSTRELIAICFGRARNAG